MRLRGSVLPANGFDLKANVVLGLASSGSGQSGPGVTAVRGHNLSSPRQVVRLQAHCMKISFKAA